MEATMGRIRNKKGLTLIELLAVVLIIGIIAAIAVPAVSNAIEKSKRNADMSTQALVKEAATRYVLDNPTATTVTVVDLQSGGYLNTVKFNDTTKHAVVSVTLTTKTGTNTGGNTIVTLVGATPASFEDLTQ
jgi:type IV pilus assembly protein PilA